MNIRRRLLFISLIALFAGCATENPVDDWAGGGGESGTMSATIENGLWQSDLYRVDSIGILHGAYALFFERPRLELAITGMNDATGEQLHIKISNVFRTGPYAVGGRYSTGSVSFQGGDALQGRRYTTSATDSGTVYITKFDRDRDVVSGTFSVRASTVAPSGTWEFISITSGSFTDLPLKEL